MMSAEKSSPAICKLLSQCFDCVSLTAAESDASVEGDCITTVAAVMCS